MGIIEVQVPPGLDDASATRAVERLLEHQGLLSRVSRALAQEDAAVSPEVLAQIGRVDRLWRTVEQRYGMLSRDDVVTLTGGNPTHARSHVANLRRRGGLLGVTRGGRLRYPAFQFTRHQIRPHWLELTRPFREAQWAEEDVLLWFAAPTGWLDGRIPADLLDTEPEAVEAAVTEVAPGIGW